MKLSDVISVDPGRTTLGALYPESEPRIVRRPVKLPPVVTTEVKRQSRSGLNFLFAAMAPGANRYGVWMLLLRLLFSALLIVSGSFILSGEIYAPEHIMTSQVFGILEITFGVMLFLGFLSRFAMFASALLFGILSVISTVNGIFDMQSMLCTFGSVLFLVAGVGKYSADFLIRKAIVKRENARKRREHASGLTYETLKYSKTS